MRLFRQHFSRPSSALSLAQSHAGFEGSDVRDELESRTIWRDKNGLSAHEKQLVVHRSGAVSIVQANNQKFT
ncbi:hypothetical protein, partial [Viridibacterium curvum]|uniref:hypothetical protein n=1 Tax=Viridibacterium curvum TaxID=1101404 RepID=UPI0031EA455D